MAVVLNRSILSLKIGEWFKLEANETVAWSSDNANVLIDEKGWVVALRDRLRPDGQATITATGSIGTATCKITIVPWRAEKHNVAIEKVYTSTHVQGLLPSKLNNKIVVADGVELYEAINGDIGNLKHLATFPHNLANIPIIETPFGFFAWTSNGYSGANTTAHIYRSTDLVNWVVEKETDFSGLYHSMDWYFDGTTLFVYAAEYGTDLDHRFKLMRGAFTSASTGTWTTIKEFYSQNEYKNSGLSPSIRHFHLVTVDKSNGYVYAGSGDSDHECFLLLSTDNGETFKVLGTGSQEYRILSVWFTEKYIYWNMDSALNQRVFRLAKANLTAQAPGNDLKEEVAALVNGSHWFHCWAKDEYVDDIVVMGSAPEGQQRDWLSRLFSIKELPDESVEVSELIALPSSTPDVYDNGITMYAQLEPKFFHDGRLYVRGRYTNPPASSSNNWLSGLMRFNIHRKMSKPKKREWRETYNFIN